MKIKNNHWKPKTISYDGSGLVIETINPELCKIALNWIREHKRQSWNCHDSRFWWIISQRNVRCEECGEELKNEN